MGRTQLFMRMHNYKGGQSEVGGARSSYEVDVMFMEPRGLTINMFQTSTWRPIVMKTNTERKEHLPQEEWETYKVQRLRKKLAEKAKREPKFRFYSLYGHIHRMDTLKSTSR